MKRRIASSATVVFACLLFAVILALRLASGDPGDATLALFVIPIGLCALEFGMRGGVAAAAFGLALLVGSDVVAHEQLSLLGLATRSTAFLLVGALLGHFVDERRALEAKIERHYDLSLDLFATAGFDGYFEELNPAWEQTLGYTTAELCSRPFVEFVHPEDRARTEAEAAKLVEAYGDSVRFRNRYRTADGEYRWLEWNVHPVAEERRLYATARDITIQHQAEQGLQSQSELLERLVRERTEALEESRLEILQRLAIAAEYRDDDTHQHTERVGRTAALVARELGLSESTVALIRRAAPLHDIGKVGVTDSILLKPGTLTPSEWELMKKHSEIGAKVLAGSKFPVVQLGAEIASTHHEHWDGRGYPNGRAGEEIPLAGRIVAVADVFDALIHERSYKAAWSIPYAVAEIKRVAGTQLDPRVVEAFMALDHRRLSEDVGSYDLNLPPPPITEAPETGIFPASPSRLFDRRTGIERRTKSQPVVRERRFGGDRRKANAGGG